MGALGDTRVAIYTDATPPVTLTRGTPHTIVLAGPGGATPAALVEEGTSVTLTPEGRIDTEFGDRLRIVVRYRVRAIRTAVGVLLDTPETLHIAADIGGAVGNVWADWREIPRLAGTNAYNLRGDGWLYGEWHASRFSGSTFAANGAALTVTLAGPAGCRLEHDILDVSLYDDAPSTPGYTPPPA